MITDFVHTLKKRKRRFLKDREDSKKAKLLKKATGDPKVQGGKDEKKDKGKDKGKDKDKDEKKKDKK